MAEYRGAPGPTEVASWQSQIVKPGAVVTQTNAAAPGASPQAIELYNMPRDVRKQLAIALKNAGYRVPTNGAYSDSLFGAFNSASLAARSQAQMLGMQFDNNYFSTYLAQEAAAKTTAGKKAKEPTTVRYKQEMRPEAIKATINEVFADVLGRGASEEEIAKYTERIQNKMSKTKNMASTTYGVPVNGVQQRVDRPGFEPQTYLYEQLSGNNEAKQRSIFGFYDAFKKALGV